MKHYPKDRTGWLFEGFEAPPLVPRHNIREEQRRYRVSIVFHAPPLRNAVQQRPKTFGELPGVNDRENNASVRHYRMLRPPYRKTI